MEHTDTTIKGKNGDAWDIMTGESDHGYKEILPQGMSFGLKSK